MLRLILTAATSVYLLLTSSNFTLAIGSSLGREGGVGGAPTRVQERIHTAHTRLAPPICSGGRRHLRGVLPLPPGTQCESLRLFDFTAITSTHNIAITSSPATLIPTVNCSDFTR